MVEFYNRLLLNNKKEWADTCMQQRGWSQIPLREARSQKDILYDSIYMKLPQMWTNLQWQEADQWLSWGERDYRKKGHFQEWLGVHHLGWGDAFMGVYMSKLIRLPTLNMCNLQYISQISIKHLHMLIQWQYSERRTKRSTIFPFSKEGLHGGLKFRRTLDRYYWKRLSTNCSGTCIRRKIKYHPKHTG